MFSQHLDLPGSEDMCTNKIRVSRSEDYLRLLIIYNVDEVSDVAHNIYAIQI